MKTIKETFPQIKIGTILISNEQIKYKVTNNCVSPSFCTKLINNFSNHILIELKTYE